MGVVGHIRDLLLPPHCVVCGRTLNLDERHVCLHCEADMPFTYFGFAGRNAMADAFNALVQKGLKEGEYVPYAPASALFYYEGDYSHLTQSLKYDGDLALGRYLARLSAGKISFPEFDVIVPVPLHWWRRFRRGFNQAAVVAAGLSASLGAPVAERLLRRVRSTRTQTVLGNEERFGNVLGAFEASPEVLRKILSSNNTEEKGGALRVLLVDDVFTTGATLCACREAILEAFGRLAASGSIPAGTPAPQVSVFTLAFARRS